MVVNDKISLRTGSDLQIEDITEKVAERLQKSGLRNGIVTLFVPGSTASLSTVEYEPGLLQDLTEAFERIVPRRHPYHHNAAWHDGNGHAHVRATVVGPSLTVPFADGHLTLGTWQQIILIDFDVPARNRSIVVQIMGE